MITSPRDWTETYCSYSTLFHSPLVGVDKETLATCALSFPREVRRRNKLWQLNSIGNDRGYLNLNSTKERWKGNTSSPHMWSTQTQGEAKCQHRKHRSLFVWFFILTLSLFLLFSCSLVLSFIFIWTYIRILGRTLLTSASVLFLV